MYGLPISEQGGDLFECLASEGKLTIQDAGMLAHYMSFRLAEKHAAGVVCGNVSPRTLLGWSGQHIGIIRTPQTQDSQNLTDALGMAEFHSPEYLKYLEDRICSRGQTNPVTTSSDSWGWAACVLLMLTGQGPYGETPKDSLRVRVVARHHDDKRLPSLPDDLVSTPLGRVLQRCLQFEPAQRPESQQLLHELWAIRFPDRQPSPSQLPPIATPSAIPSSSPSPKPSSRNATSRPRSGSTSQQLGTQPTPPCNIALADPGPSNRQRDAATQHANAPSTPAPLAPDKGTRKRQEDAAADVGAAKRARLAAPAPSEQTPSQTKKAEKEQQQDTHKEHERPAEEERENAPLAKPSEKKMLNHQQEEKKDKAKALGRESSSTSACPTAAKQPAAITVAAPPARSLRSTKQPAASTVATPPAQSLRSSKAPDTIASHTKRMNSIAVAIPKEMQPLLPNWDMTPGLKAAMLSLRSIAARTPPDPTGKKRKMPEALQRGLDRLVRMFYVNAEVAANTSKAKVAMWHILFQILGPWSVDSTIKAKMQQTNSRISGEWQLAKDRFAALLEDDSKLQGEVHFYRELKDFIASLSAYFPCENVLNKASAMPMWERASNIWNQHVPEHQQLPAERLMMMYERGLEVLNKAGS